MTPVRHQVRTRALGGEILGTKTSEGVSERHGHHLKKERDVEGKAYVCAVGVGITCREIVACGVR